MLFLLLCFIFTNQVSRDLHRPSGIYGMLLNQQTALSGARFRQRGFLMFGRRYCVLVAYTNLANVSGDSGGRERNYETLIQFQRADP
jgi:hypothetical protein